MVFTICNGTSIFDWLKWLSVCLIFVFNSIIFILLKTIITVIYIININLN